jgi:putative hydrolase of the HAD superfamily
MMPNQRLLPTNAGSVGSEHGALALLSMEVRERPVFAFVLSVRSRNVGVMQTTIPVLMAKGILFDLDGTLWDRDVAVRALVIEQHQLFAAALAAIPLDVYVTRVLELDAHGHGDKTAAYRQLATEFGLDDGLAATLTDHFWATYHGFCRAFPEVPGVLAQLRERGLKLGIITNGTVRVQGPVLSRLGLDTMVDVVLISEREGVRKPQREIFDRAVRMLSLTAADIWYVGDHPITDVQGAAAAGLMAIWRRTPFWLPPIVPHHDIERLDELLAFMEPSPSLLHNMR